MDLKTSPLSHHPRPEGPPNKNKNKNKSKRLKIYNHIFASFIITLLIIYLCHSSKNVKSHHQQVIKTIDRPLSFSLKHVYHHSTKDDEHIRLDVTPKWLTKNQDSLNIMGNDNKLWPQSLKDISNSNSPWSANYGLKTKHKLIRRMKQRNSDFVESYINWSHKVGSSNYKIDLEWIDEDVEVPDITDKNTVLLLAGMSADAYQEIPGLQNDWFPVYGGFNNSKNFSYGWNNTGLRGHIFVSDDKSTVVISIKGTSAALFYDGGGTVNDDKINDNLLFSCCCARVSYMWTTVCDCYKGGYTCDADCIEKELYGKDHYYQASLDIYRNVTSMYPNSNIWVTGHSLGGSISSFLGRTFGLPVVAFEAPGDLLPTRRLHLPLPPSLPPWLEYIWHFGNTADPIYMGVCNGASSSCSLAGYAMETKCHSGFQCIYDTVTDLGWHVNMLNHRIHTVIDDILYKYNDTAKCVVPPECFENCFNWKFINGNEDNPSFSTSSISEPTSESEPIHSTSVPLDGSSCVGRNWYGRCTSYIIPNITSFTSTVPTTSSHLHITSTKKEETLTSTLISTPVHSKAESYITTPPPSSSKYISTITTTTTETETCIRYNWYYKCVEYGPITSSSTSMIITPSPESSVHSTNKPEETCLKRNWRYQCIEYGSPDAQQVFKTSIK